MSNGEVMMRLMEAQLLIGFVGILINLGMAAMLAFGLFEYRRRKNADKV